MSFIKNLLSRYWFIVVAIILLLLFLVNATKQENLDVYNKEDYTYTVESETEEEKDVKTFTYMNEKLNLSIEIPDGWEKVTKDGFDTYIHKASASSIQIQTLSYYPMVNNATAESLAETYNEQGYTVTEFQKTAGNSYYVIYQGQGISGITDYVENVIWDRSHVVKIVITFNDSYYEKLEDEIWIPIDSLQWDYEDPIDENYYLTYQRYGDFEFAVPVTWASGYTDSSFYAYDEETGAMMTVNLLEDSTMINDISQVDYTDFLSANKQNFALSQFSQQDNEIYGEATYINNDIYIALMQKYIANGQYHYIITYEYPAEMSDYYYLLCQNGLSYIRLFNTVPDALDEASVFSPNEIPETTTAEEETESVYTPELDTTPSQQETEDSPSEVSSFAEALMSVAEIPQENANNISSIWDSLNAGIPTYAEAYKKSDTGLIILVTNDQNVNYFLYVRNDGVLTDIRVNTEDGPSVYSN